MQDSLQVAQIAHGMSDTVQLAIVAGIVAIATLVIKGFIDSKAKKAETLAAVEAAKVSAKLAEVEIKIDGRLTQLLEISKKEAEERGHRLGKAEGKDETIILPSADAKLKITGGEIKITGETKKKS